MRSSLKTFLRFSKKDIAVCRHEAILFFSVLLLSGAVMPSNREPPIQFYSVPAAFALPGHPWVALTFDDGPHPVLTERLLDVLKKEHVPATFFVVGKMAERYPDVLRKIAGDGDEIENHTYDHLNLARLSSDQVLEELNRTRSAIRRITGQDSIYFRPPGGDYSRMMLHSTIHNGYHMVLWSVLTDDVEGASARAIRSRILASVNDNAIILLHSGVEGTVEALPGVITSLRQRGYHFVTVSTLIKFRHSADLQLAYGRHAPASVQVQ
jgi:peptidoglycan/xylan/chitin deacetylase (PgdA/CDA1 family)